MPWGRHREYISLTQRMHKANYSNYLTVRFLAFPIVLLVTAVFFIFAAFFSTFPGDAEALERFQGLRSTGLDGAARVATYMANTEVAVPLVVLVSLALWLGRRKVDSVICLLVLVADAFTIVLKVGVGRARPDFALFPPPPGDPGFPSGHATSAVVFFGFLIYLTAVLVDSTRLRVAIQGILFLVILMCGASRVYLGIHWPSDVLGGFLYGGVSLWVLIWLGRRWQRGSSYRRGE